MGNTRVCIGLLLWILRAKEIHNTNCYVSISKQFQIRVRRTYIFLWKVSFFLKSKCSHLWGCAFLMMKLKLSLKNKGVKKNFSDVFIPGDWSVFIQEFPVPWALTCYYCFWSQCKLLCKWLGMQALLL